MNINAMGDIILGTAGSIIHTPNCGTIFSCDPNHTDHSADFSNFRVINVGEPIESTDGATKGYVDNITGDINTILEAIIASQNALIGGAE